MRLGYVIARPDFIVHLKKIRGPYDVNMVAVLAAREQLNHPEHWQGVVRHLMDESKPALEIQNWVVRTVPKQMEYQSAHPHHL